MAQTQAITLLRSAVAAALLVTLPGSGHLHADTIFLKNGRQIVAASVTESGDKIYYESGYGQVSIPKDMVERIERGGAVPIASSPPPAAESRDRQPDADLPPAGIRLSLDASRIEQFVVNGGVNNQLVEELVSKATNSPEDRKRAVDAQLLAAVHEARSGRVADASKWAEEALRTDHFDRNALLLATQLDLTLRKYREAVQHMEIAYGQDPNSADVLLLLGDAYYFSEGAEKAVQFWKKAHLIRPEANLGDRIDRVSREAELERNLSQAESFHFVLSWQGSEHRDSFGRMVLDELERSFGELESVLAYSPRDPITVILYGSQDFADITRAPGWAGAVNDGKIRMPVHGLTGLTPELVRVLKHELTHSFIYQITGARCPTWFNEGLAQFLAGESLDEFGSELGWRYAASRQMPLHRLEGPFTRLNSAQAFLAYGESLAAVHMIHDHYGDYSLTDLLRALAAGQSMTEALEKVLRLGYGELEQELAAYLAKRFGR